MEIVKAFLHDNGTTIEAEFDDGKSITVAYPVPGAASGAYVDVLNNWLESNTPGTQYTLAELKVIRIAGVKLKAREILNDTDWMQTRELDGGVSVAAEVVTARNAVRTASNTIEDAINAIDTYETLVAHTYDLEA